MEREVKIGNIYKHFKGNLYKVLNIGCDSETLKKMVIYQDVNDISKIWVRKYDDFISLVDKSKYPNVTQKFRFEEYDNKN